ncbi:MAG: hypothetical protein KIS80_10195 [Anaerolineales bacterium]|nr:hypothetical protein [Anaerolineales bacterium]
MWKIPKWSAKLAGLVLCSVILILPIRIQGELAGGSYYSGPTETPVPNPELLHGGGVLTLELQLSQQQAEIDHLRELLDLQTSIYEATVNRMESNFNTLIAVLTVGSLVLAILGFGFLNTYLANKLNDLVQNISEEKFKLAFEQLIARYREEWDPKFTELYEEYSKAIKNDRKES